VVEGLTALTAWDYAGMAVFALCWLGYTIYADRGTARGRSVSAAMGRFRRRWMLEMLDRDVRMVDANIVGNILTGVAFFASSSILIVGGLAAALGALDEASAVLDELSAGAPPPRAVWEIKLLLLLAIFVYAFFKFAWAFRLYNYTSILVGAAPAKPVAPEVAKVFAKEASEVGLLAANHFNRGLRSFFFALAAMGWFVHPIAMIAASLWVVYVVHRREFRSKSLMALRATEAGLAGHDSSRESHGDGRW